MASGTALADGPAGADPSANYPVNQLPSSCDQPTSTACLGASVGFLNKARASLGQGPYLLPSNFATLSAPIQVFVLANLDRQLYRLAPITGLTDGLGRDAAAAVGVDADPHPSDSSFTYWTANWAGGFGNVVLAYEAWMYDDGPGSGNLDCTSSNPSGCWGHRHDVLWDFGGSGPLAMGTAAGTDSSGSPGEAMLLGEGDGLYHPVYTYTWSQAVAAGAGISVSPVPGGVRTGSSGGAGAGSASGSSTGSGAGPGTSPAATRAPARSTVVGPGTVTNGHGLHAVISVRGGRIAVRIQAAPGAALSCALTPRREAKFARDRFRGCRTSTIYTAVPRGRYRLRVRTADGSITVYLRIG